MHVHMCTFAVSVAAAGNLALALYRSDWARKKHLHTESQLRCCPDKYGYYGHVRHADVSDCDTYGTIELRATGRPAKVIMYESGAHDCTTPTSGTIRL